MTSLDQSGLISRNLRILITAAPVIAYALNYAYELAWANYFNIPPQLITLTLSSVIYALCVFGVVLFIAIPMIDPLIVFISSIPSRILRSYILLFVGLLVFAVWSAMLNGWVTGVIVFGVVLVLALLTFLQPVFYPSGTYVEKFERRIRSQGNDRDFASHLMSAVGYDLYTLIGLFAVLLIAFYSVGQWKAATKEYFLVSSTDQQVVINIYGENYLTVPHPVDGRFEPSFSMKKVATDSGERFELKRLGRIKVR